MNFESLPIKFCNKKTLNIKSDDYKEYLLDFIKSTYRIDITKRNYRSYRNENLSVVENFDSIVSTVSMGNSYWMFLYRDAYSMKSKCYMIDGRTNKGYKYPKIVTVFCRFSDKVFNGTLFKGELIRDKDNNWIYLIDDLFVDCGENIRNNSKIDRIAKTHKLINNSFIEDTYLQPFSIQIKKYFKPEEVTEMTEKFIPSLNYSCRGIMIHTNHRIFNNLYINFENSYNDQNKNYKKSNIRDAKPIDKKIVRKNITTNIVKTKKPPTPREKTRTTMMLSDLNKDKIKIDTKVSDKTKTENKLKFNKSCCVVLNLVKTDNPDVYKLFAVGKADRMKRVSYAHIPNIETSKYLQNEFTKLDETQDRFNVLCEYIPDGKKWIPRIKVDDEIASVDIVKKLKKSLK